MWFVMAALLAPSPPADIVFAFPKTEFPTAEACQRTVAAIREDWAKSGKVGRVACYSKG